MRFDIEKLKAENSICENFILFYNTIHRNKKFISAKRFKKLNKLLRKTQKTLGDMD